MIKRIVGTILFFLLFVISTPFALTGLFTLLITVAIVVTMVILGLATVTLLVVAIIAAILATLIVGGICALILFVVSILLASGFGKLPIRFSKGKNGKKDYGLYIGEEMAEKKDTGAETPGKDGGAALS